MSELPMEVAMKIAEEHIDVYEELKVFGQICGSWRNAMKSSSSSKCIAYHTPWLMLTGAPPGSLKHQLYNLRNLETRHVALPQPPLWYDDDVEGKLDIHHLFHDEEDNHGEHRYFSSRGWLISLTQFHLNITLVNPFTAQTIRAPRAPMKSMQFEDGYWYEQYYQLDIRKFCLSDSPSANKDFTLAMLFKGCRYSKGIAFWRNGDDDWTYIDHCRPSLSSIDIEYLDLIVYRGEFYCINQVGGIHALGKANAIGKAWPTPSPRLVANYSNSSFAPEETKAYLVESNGSLLLVVKEPFFGHMVVPGCTELMQGEAGCIFYETHYFTVWDVNVDTGRITEVNDLGNTALFLGWNSSFSLEASPDRGILPNCIYYTDDFLHYYLYSDCRPGGSDMGVYDMRSRTTKQIYDGPSRFSNVTPPIWIEPFHPPTHT